MANTTTDLDWASPMACRHCAKPLHGVVRFCPYCGGEEAAMGAEAATALVGVTAVESHAADSAVAPMPQLSIDAVAQPQPRSRRKASMPSVLAAPKAPRGTPEPETALLGPAAFEWPEGLPAVITVEPHAPKSRLAELLVKPAAIGTALVLSVLALVIGYVQPGQRDEPERAQEPVARAEQAPQAEPMPVQGMAAGAVAAAAPALAAATQVPREERGPRDREPTVDAAQQAAQALGLSGLSGLSDPPATPQTAPALSAAAAASATEPAVAQTAPPAPAPSPCSDTLAALSLCISTDTAQPQPPAR
ncbi:hypothetical protein [Variovorax sp. KK3]|uniref:hypothetical protein n=1 Tax=Variovorax sp. KK3 TaxID=1855728 RepID=UPI00097BD25E|nr:hypothetical protein [Variovorax sp. KK3]